MFKFVPHDVDYQQVKQVSNVATVFLVISALLSFSVVIIDATKTSSYEQLVLTLNSIISILSVLFFLSDIIQNYLFQQAELNRKNDFIDNGLKTKISDKNSKGYFTNEEITPGIIKLGVNGFENCFFTKNISGYMIKGMVVKSVTIITLFMLVALFTEQKTLATLLQVALPFTILQQTTRLVVFHNRIKSVYKMYKHIFSASENRFREALIVDNIINYEKTLSWATILLNSTIFKKHNDRLSADWNNVKKQLGIPPF